MDLRIIRVGKVLYIKVTIGLVIRNVVAKALAMYFLYQTFGRWIIGGRQQWGCVSNRGLRRLC